MPWARQSQVGRPWGLAPVGRVAPSPQRTSAWRSPSNPRWTEGRTPQVNRRSSKRVRSSWGRGWSAAYPGGDRGKNAKGKGEVSKGGEGFWGGGLVPRGKQLLGEPLRDGV